jgi:CubicO group peptidase (beta-lactamase class C family)
MQPEADLESALAVVDGWDVDQVAVGVLTAGGATVTRGADDAPFQLASVTKPLTAAAVLLAVEEGVLGLDDPAGPEGSTVRHLLAHASGLGPDGGILSAPGRRRVYSNAGFDLLGTATEAATGMAFAAYLDEGILAPLGMASTHLAGSPAFAGVGTVADLLRFAGELLHPAVLAPATVAEATSVQFPGLSGVLPGIGRMETNDWGLGFELRDSKTPHWTAPDAPASTFGHFGGSGTFLWVDPELGVACVCLTDRDFGPWALEAWPPLSAGVRVALGG